MTFVRHLTLLAPIAIVAIGTLVAAPASAVVTDTNIWINEFHYDDAGADANEFVEIVAPTSFANLSDVTLTLYNGSNGTPYGTHTLDTFTPGAISNGFTIYSKLIAGIQNGDPDGLALDNAGALLQFISYEGAPFMGVGGAANGALSTDIGENQAGGAAENSSVGLRGLGDSLQDFTGGGAMYFLSSGANTIGAVNDQQGIGIPDIKINEIRGDEPGVDDNEYFELVGAPGTSLAGLTYLVIGDGTGGSGVIEAVIDLGNLAIPADGFFLAAENTFSLGGMVDLTTDLNFENSDNVTHLLVASFTGANGDDLDTNDDGILDIQPWFTVLDAVGIVESVGTGDQLYAISLGGTNVGPDGAFQPGHVFRDPNATGAFQIGAFDPVGGDDTPGTANPENIQPPTGNVPEPATLSLLALGAAGMLRRRRVA